MRILFYFLPFYRIVVKSIWNGCKIIFCHFYTLFFIFVMIAVTALAVYRYASSSISKKFTDRTYFSTYGYAGSLIIG